MKIVANNKKANFLYKMEKKVEAGLVLTGTEIKSLRAGSVSISESYAKIYKGECYLYNMHISPYEFGNIHNPDPLRPRKLLLHKKELRYLIGKMQEQGLTLVPTRLYLNERGRAKIELGLGRGKKIYDKRESIKKREVDRKISRSLRS
jgi:SsrA-binding protein